LPSTIYTDFVTPVVAASLNDFNTATYVTVPSHTTSIATNTSDILLKANIASPTFTGVPAAPTAAAATITTQVATTAFATNADLGIAQTYQDFTASRVSGTTYTSPAGKPIAVSVTSTVSTLALLEATVGGVLISSVRTNVGAGNETVNLYFIVPPSTNYSVSATTSAIAKWVELR
jgi:hypothetical protein